MTILFAGGEDTSGSPLGNAGVYTAGGGFYDASFCRSSFTADTSAADPPINRWVFPAFTSVSMLWFSAQLLFRGANTLNNIGIIFRSPDGVARIVVRQTATANGIKISSRNLAGTFVDLVTATTIPTSARHKLDIQITYGVAGSINWWIDGVAQPSFTGDTHTDSAALLNVVELASLNSSAAPTHFSEVIVADTDTRAMRMWTLVPQAAGNTQAWTPNTVGNINEVTLNDATAIATASNNVLSEWTVSTAIPSGTWVVRALAQEARVQVPLSGPQHFDWVVRTGGTDYLSGAPQAPAPGTPFANFQRLWPTNPATSNPWTPSEITAAGFNLGITSQA